MFTLRFMCSPLLGVLTSMDYESFIFWSYLVGVVFVAPIWAWIAGQYFFRRHVERWLLETVMLLTIVHALFFESWVVAIPLCLLSVMVFGRRKRRQNLEILFTITAHWLTAYCCHEGGLIPFYMLTALFFVTTVSFNLIFRYPEWDEWLKGERVSIVPSYALSAIFMMIMQFNFISILAA